MLRALRALALSLLCSASFGVPAATLRIASGFDPQTMDPHALALLYHTRVITQIYESLVWRDEQYRIEPGLAVSWHAVNPTTWRFRLRPGVTFHDGSPFTADDAVFSIERVLAPPSQRAFHLQGVTSAKKIDDLTIEVSLSTPDAVLPEKFFLLGMMSKAWAVKHGVQRAQDFNGKQETFTVRNANGTGPFRLDRYEPDVRTVLKANPNWWGRGDKRTGNVDEVTFVAIKQDATRLAALTSGEIDLVLDPPFQDVDRLKRDARLTLLQIPDLGQQYFTFDQSRDELLHGDVKDRNPFKDKRVRQAVYQAINVELIVQKVLRGQATPTGAFLSSRVDGVPPELDRRLPYEPAAAKALLAQAGYPNGFAVTLDCVNIAYRENVCQAATAMLAQVGIRTSLRSAATNQFFPKLSQGTASFIEFGWTPTTDAWASLNALFRSWDKSGAGTFNAGRYSNPQLDALIDSIRVEPDMTRRRAMIATALRLIRDDLPYIPLYRRTLTWAMNKKVQAVQWPADSIELRWVRVR
ncbi:Heme-binding protein A [Burkholderiaceae bacterium]|nr:Heme-binding protein A [Burkholderiaceae bacterium]